MEALELELEEVESQIRALVVRRSRLREQLCVVPNAKAVSSPKVRGNYNHIIPSTSIPRPSLSRPSAPGARLSQASFTPTPGYHGAWVQPRKVLPRSWGRTSPPVFEISTENCFSPLRESGPDVAIIGDSIVRHVRAASSKDSEAIFQPKPRRMKFCTRLWPAEKLKWSCPTESGSLKVFFLHSHQVKFFFPLRCRHCLAWFRIGRATHR
ncbi:uncharacterized protein isoform X2 [Danio rerio]